jgi:phosphoribosylaminoimidazole-succinocarboxamide synthase
VRDWLEACRVDGKPWDKKAPAPELPAQLVRKIEARYREVYTLLSS